MIRKLEQYERSTDFCYYPMRAVPHLIRQFEQNTFTLFLIDIKSFH